MRVWGWAAACLAVLATLLGLGDTGARAAGAPAFPVLSLPAGPAGGAGALSILGGHLAPVAAFYGKSPGQLRRQFLSDPSLRVDRRGRLYFADPLPRTKPRFRAARSGSAWVGGDLAPLDKTFALHSNPGADKTIYLNFRGRIVAGTAWNFEVSSVTVPPFDTDGNPASFSDDELTTIQFTWQRLAEDFAPFDVDVTTEAPPQDRISRSNAADKIFGAEVLIVPLGGPLNCWCTGISYLSAFFDTTDFFKPALVFYDGTWASPQYLADSAAHEAGHNLGLSNDGNSMTLQYDGHGDDPVNGWQPIMGSEGWRPLSQFSNGDYFDANNQEDDFAVIQNLGLPLRADEAGDSPAAALPLPVQENGGRSSGSFDGIIASAADRDVFAIWAGEGILTVKATPAAASPNADLLLTLRDPAGQVLAVSNPQHDLSAGFDYVLTSAGRYTLEVKGTGEGDPKELGYSAYGSVGAYRLAASYPYWPGNPPIASFTASPATGNAPLTVNLDPSASQDDAGITGFDWQFGDGGGATAETAQVLQKVFSLPGRYKVELRVHDVSGLSATAEREVIVSEAPGPKVTRLTVNVTGSGKKKSKAKATAMIVDASGKPAGKAVVAALWSGAASRAVSARSNSRGTASFTSPPGLSGCYRLTVTAIKLGPTNYVLNPPASGAACR